MLFSREYRKRTAFNCLFFVCIVMPYFAIYTFLPSILQKLGLAEGFGTELMLNMLLILGALIGIWCTVKFSRRGFLINSFIILAVALFMLAALPGSAPFLMVLVFGVFTLVLSAVSNLVGVFPAESFPTEVRASGIGLATAVSRLGSAVSTFLLPVSVAGIGLSPTMGILASILALGAIISWAWAPETKSLTLSQACKAQSPVESGAPVTVKVAAPI